MAKKIAALFAAVSCAALLNSCSVTLPVCATSNPIGSKVGEATAVNLFGIFWLNGDASLTTAAKNGGIKSISTVDIKQTILIPIAPILLRYTTVVTGE
jgi:hypothetical protein